MDSLYHIESSCYSPSIIRYFFSCSPASVWLYLWSGSFHGDSSREGGMIWRLTLEIQHCPTQDCLHNLWGRGRNENAGFLVLKLLYGVHTSMGHFAAVIPYSLTTWMTKILCGAVLWNTQLWKVVYLWLPDVPEPSYGYPYLSYPRSLPNKSPTLYHSLELTALTC